MEYSPPQFSYFYLENLKLTGIPKICHMICPCEKARMIPTEPLRELEGDHQPTLLHTLEISTSDHGRQLSGPCSEFQKWMLITLHGSPVLIQGLNCSLIIFQMKKSGQEAGEQGNATGTQGLSFQMLCFLIDRRIQRNVKASASLYFNVCVASTTDNFKLKFEHYYFLNNIKKLIQLAPFQFSERIVPFQPQKQKAKFLNRQSNFLTVHGDVLKITLFWTSKTLQSIQVMREDHD